MNVPLLTGLAATGLGILGYVQEAKAYFLLRERIDEHKERSWPSYYYRRNYYRRQKLRIFLNALMCIIVAGTGAFLMGANSL